MAIAIAVAAGVLVWTRRSRAVHGPVASARTPAGSAIGSAFEQGAVSDASVGGRHVDTAAREQLRARILAGNHQLAASADAAMPSSAAVPADAGWRPLVLSPEAEAYRDRTFERAESVLNDCVAKSRDAGLQVKVEYVVIADDEAGGMFEDVQLPRDGNTSGPETLDCIMNGMLAATLPAPPADIDRIHFSVEQITQIIDART